MGTISLQIPQVNLPNSTEDVKVASDFNVLQTLLNGNVDTNNLKSNAGVKRGQLALGASFPNRVVIETGTYNAVYGDFIILEPVGPMTVTLPSVTASGGGLICIYAGPGVSNTNVVTVAGSGGAVIYVPPAGFTATSTLVNPGTCWLMITDGTSWYIALSTPGSSSGSGPPH